MPRGFFHHWSAVLIALLGAGCGESGSTGDEAAVRALAPYARTWQAAEPLYRDDAFNPVAEAVHAMRPEYSVQEIEDLLVVPADVDYTLLRVEGQTITFLNGATVLCAGRYSPRVAHDHASADAGAHEHASRAFDLVATSEGECSTYALLDISVIEVHGSRPHFHIIHGTTSGPLRPRPWNPAAWPTEMTPSEFAAAAMGAVSFFASALPPR